MNVTCDVLTFRVSSVEDNVCSGDHLAQLTTAVQAK